MAGFSPSPLRGEGWGEGWVLAGVFQQDKQQKQIARGAVFTAKSGPSPPPLSPKGRGAFKATEY